MKIKNKAFVFILGISLITLICLVIGSFMFAKDNSLAFSDDGYIINSASERYYFKSGTAYKENLEHKYAFKTENNDDVVVDKNSFIHYTDNSFGFMQNGAIMDLNSANMSIVPYYNITNKSTIIYNDGKYIVKTANKTLEFENILGRISDDKYIVVGKNMTLKLPDREAVIEANYFEVTFIEDGIVRIVNQEGAYQTTTQGTYINIGDKIVLDFNSMKVVYDGESEMSLSQLTINGNENIDILPDSDTSEDGSSDGIGEGEGAGGDTGNDNDNTVEDPSTQDEPGDGASGEDTVKTDTYIELLDASVGPNSIRASFKYNNTRNIEGNLVINITNIGTGSKVYSKILDKTKDTEDVFIESLAPDTNYLLTISSSNNDSDISSQYFQQSFRTQDLGITLNRVYATSNSLTYKVNYSDNSNVKSLDVYLCNENLEKIEGSGLRSSYDNNDELTFSNLDSNTSYVVCIPSVIMNGFEYVNSYYISRTDITLKKTPDASTMRMEARSSSNVSAFLSVSKVTDVDSSIKSYTFKIYPGEYDGNTKEIFSKKVSASEDTTTASMKLDLDDLPYEYRDLEYYRFSVDITYYDNEKTMTLMGQQISSKFYLSSEAQDDDEGKLVIEFEQDYDKTTYSSIVGTIKITDSLSRILVNGRDGYGQQTKFVIRYYSGDISTTESISIDVDSSDIDADGKIVKDIELTGLTHNSGYIIEVYADMYDEAGKNVVNQIVDRSFTGTTKSDVDKLRFDIVKDNGSDDTNVINFEGRLVPTNPDMVDTLEKVTVKLYKGGNAEVGNQIGETIELQGSDIFNNNYNFTNNSFGITDVYNLIELSGDRLYQSYTIELTDAMYVSGNVPDIENNVYTYTISLAYILEKELDEPTIAVEPIYNGDTYPELDSSTIIGYEVTAGAAVERIKELLGTTGIESINYYIYKVDGDGSEKLIKTEQTDDLSVDLFFEDINEYNRGGSYRFKYDISLSGLDEKYPRKQVWDNETYIPEKQGPLFSIYKSTSDKNSITYKYKFVDIDKSIHVEDGGGYKFYYSVNDSSDYKTADLVISDDYQDLVIGNLNQGDTYKINYYKEVVENDPRFTEIEDYAFEGEYDINQYNVTYDLQYNSNDNRLAIKINDNEFINRIMLYKVVISASGVDNYEKIFTSNDLTTCPNGEDINCLIVDYASIENFMGKNSSVKVDAYYDKGIIGIDSKSDYGYIFKSRDNNYLNLKDEFKIDSYSSSIYDFNYDDNNININDFFDKDIASNLELNYVSNGISYGNKGVFDPKVIDYGNLSTSNNKFRFDSIIPKINAITKNRTISTVSVGGEFLGLSLSALKEQFKSDDGKYYVYIEMYDDEDCTLGKREGQLEVVEDSSNLGYSLKAYEFSDLMPETTYYYKLYAYLKQPDGDYSKIELFDARNDSSYVNSVYNIATLSALEIFSNVAAYYLPSTYSTMNLRPNYNSGRTLQIRYSVKSGSDFNAKVNYALRLQLLDEEGNDYFKNIGVNVTASSNVVLNGDNYKGKDKQFNINFSSSNDYMFIYFSLDDEFIFGSGYYTLVLTAVSNNSSNSEVELYRQLLTTRNTSDTASRVDIPELSEPSFNFTPSIDTSGNIVVSVSVNDPDAVIINNTKNMNSVRGQYSISLVDSNYRSLCSSRTGSAGNSSGLPAGNSTQFTFNKKSCNISDDTAYYIQVDTYIYRNNLSLDNSKKLSQFQVRKVVYTTGSKGVSTGNVSTRSTANSIILTYTGASGLDQVDKVIYTISEDGGQNLVGSTTKTKSSNRPIFAVSGSNYTLTLDGFTLTSGKTYLVEIAYYSSNEQLFKETYTVVRD